jgi:hypothetical protein
MLDLTQLVLLDLTQLVLVTPKVSNKNKQTATKWQNKIAQPKQAQGWVNGI